MKRGACPTLPEPMPTGDGLLARFVPRAPLSPMQAAGLAEAARAHGNGIVQVTSRGSLQVRGLSEASAPRLGDDLATLGIEPRLGFRVEVPSLAGRDGAPDPRPLAAAIEHGAAALAGRLAPKLSVIVDGGGPLHLDALPADIRLRMEQGRHVLSCAGVRLGAVAEAAAALAVLRLLAAIAEHGASARAADLPGPPDIGDLEPCVEPPPLPAAEPVGCHVLADGALVVGIALPFGQTDRLGALAAGLPEHARLIPAPGRALLMVGLDEMSARAAQADAAALGFIVAADDPRRSVVACPGGPACASGRLPAPALAETLAPFARGRIVHVSGCAKGCAHPGSAALTIVGLDRGAGLVLDGSARAAPRRVVPLCSAVSAARAMLETVHA